MVKTGRMAGWRALVAAALVVAGLGLGASRDVGPAVGEKAPDFSAVDQHGTTRTLASLMGSRGLMLVFFRSADW